MISMHSSFAAPARVLLVVGMSALNIAPGVEAQEFGQCPVPTADADTLIHQIELIAAGELTLGRSTPSSAISLAVRIPFGSAPCPFLRPDVDRATVMIRLLEYARDHEDVIVSRDVMRYGGMVAFRYRDELGWNPTNFLFDAVETSRTEPPRLHRRLVYVSATGEI
jgi:hypothetical protein